MDNVLPIFLCDLRRGRSLVVPCPLTWHRGAAAFLRPRIGVFYVVVACPLTCHSRRSRVFLRQRIGVAANAATRAECHVNGHGTTTQPHPLTCHLRCSLVGPCPLTWHRGRSFYVVVACPLTCHSRRSRVFLRQRIGVAANAATRAECHVNGHGTTTQPHPLQKNCNYSYHWHSRTRKELMWHWFVIMFTSPKRE